MVTGDQAGRGCEDWGQAWEKTGMYDVCDMWGKTQRLFQKVA